MRVSIIAVLALVPALCGCDRADAPAALAGAAPSVTPAQAPRAVAAAAWHLASGSEGAALAIDDAAGRTSLRAWCQRGGGRLWVNVPGFAPIASEERMSFGQGGEVVALVADSSGDGTRGGVTAQMAVPANLRALLSGPVAATYGAQVSGPHPVPPPELVSAFVAACGPAAGDAGAALPVAAGAGEKPASPAGVSACLVQDGHPVPVQRLRAVGTEPFWGARVEGRCVTYSDPGDPGGTRVWTRYSGTAEAGVWRGALHGKPFVMRTQPRAGCSDGMSDTRYPFTVSLTVDGQARSGCAAPQD